MGKLFRGIDDLMRGRLGNHVGRYLRGENIIAMRPVPSSKPATELQLIQRAKFGFLNSWLSPLSSFIDVGFKHYDAEMSARNACMSYNFKQSVLTGVAPDFAIDYSKLVLSRGTLTGLNLPNIGTATGIAVEFSWENNIGNSNAKLSDDLSFVVYDPISDTYAVLIAAVKRSALSYEMVLPAEFDGHTVHGWVMCVSEDGKLVSDSKHVGTVPVG